MKFSREYFFKGRRLLPEFTIKRIKFLLLVSLSLLGIGFFVNLSHNLFFDIEDAAKIRHFDDSALTFIAQFRSAALTASAVDITALGSITVITLIVCVFFIALLMTRDYLSVTQLIIATGGAAFWTRVFKSWLERPRPPMLSRLVDVSGYSFPSGHALASATLYITFAIMAARHFKAWWEHIVLFFLALLIIVLVALSRVYLGVHYPSDVLSGVCLGSAWAFLVAASIALYGREKIN